MISLHVQSFVDPADLAVNVRYKSSQALPRRVSDAMTNLQDDVFEAIRGNTFIDGPWEPPKVAEIYFMFCFNTRQNDVDGPLKHALDAVQNGIRKAGFPEWSDREVYGVHIEKWVGLPNIQVAIQEADRCTRLY